MRSRCAVYTLKTNRLTMKHKYAELDIYEDFIHGNLEPARLNGAHLTTISKYLSEELEECQDMILGKFRKKGKSFELIEKLRISNGHPLATSFFSNDQIQFPNLVSEVVAKQVLEQLEIDGLDQINPIVFKKKENYTMIGIPFQSEWSELESDRLKYCYFHHQLQEIVRKTKANLRTDVFNATPEEACSLIQGVQRLLLSYLQDIVNQYDLKEENLIISVKQKYSNQDCAALIYLSIVDILNFIFQHFNLYLDVHLVVPFFSKVANQNEFVSRSRQILKNLKQLEIDKPLVDIISDQLEKVLKIDLKSRITYSELNYFKNFLSTFHRFLERKGSKPLSKDQIVRFLISFNFNDFLFFEYLIEWYKNELLDCDTFDDMELYLLRKQSELKQIVSNSREALIQSQANLILILNDWIDVELSYVLKMKETNALKPTTSNPDQIQLTTNMTVSELTLLFKILETKKHVQANTTNEMAKWLRQSFKNQKSEAFSLQNIRNNVYNFNPTAKERIKGICIDILNEVNSI